jgi:sugar O-acyltransferase (sialic acid O-acetyltransferase NeuD family)
MTLEAPIPLVILGTGGNAVEIVETVDDINTAARGPRRYACVGFLDDNRDRWGHLLHGLPILGPLASGVDFPDARFVNGIGSPNNFWNRAAIVAKTGVPAERFETLIHPTATVSRTARLGHGVVVFPHVTIGASVEIDDHAIVLPSSVISHDSVVGAHTCVAAGVRISGAVSVGACCYLGTGASIIGSVTIGDGTLVGMGSVVLKDVPAGVVVVGNPGRFLRRVRGFDVQVAG